jgi:carboxyl-terminal processing protease
MLSVLDPHSTYFDPIEYASFRTEQRSEYFGIGATIEDLREGNDVNTFIRATFPESPAQRAGLRFGDRILAVDGNSMKGKTYPRSAQVFARRARHNRQSHRRASSHKAV